MHTLLALFGIAVIGVALIGFVRALWRAPGGVPHGGHDPVPGGTSLDSGHHGGFDGGHSGGG